MGASNTLFGAIIGSIFLEIGYHLSTSAHPTMNSVGRVDVHGQGDSRRSAECEHDVWSGRNDLCAVGDGLVESVHKYASFLRHRHHWLGCGDLHVHHFSHAWWVAGGKSDA